MNKYQIERAKNFEYYLQRWEESEGLAPAEGVNCGARGRAFELEMTRERSRKKDVALDGYVDNTVQVMINGQKVFCPLECKTCGGRVESLYRGLQYQRKDGKPRFVVYRLDWTGKPSKLTGIAPEVHTPALLMPVWFFLAGLEKFGKIRTLTGFDKHGRPKEERSIQTSNKGWHKFLAWYAENYGYVYDPEAVYDIREFDGMTLPETI